MMGAASTVILAASFAWVWIEYYGYVNTHNKLFVFRGHLLMIGIYAFFIYVFFKLYDGYKFGIQTRTNVVYSQTVALAIVNTLTYFLISLIYGRLQNPVPMILLTGIDVSCVVLWTILFDAIYFHIYPPRKMIIVYDGEDANLLIKKMYTRKEKYQICASVKADVPFENICESIKPYDAIIICDVKPEMRNRLIQHCFDSSIRAYVTADIADILIRGADNIIINDTPLLLCKSRGLNLEQRIVKRTIDLVISILGIVITSPIMLITAIAIKLFDRGPVLFKQVRTTRGGKDFKIWKFRSMIVNAEKESGAVLASVNDSRITPIGKIIRRYRIDELPQLFNILLGDMSVVGPRPERPEIIADYIKEMPEFKYRLKVKAGLTGYAQVLGKYNTTPKDKLKMDMIYIENYSALMDIKLIFMTLKIMFVKESTEGVDEEK